jgi:hypothetical protein
MEQILALYALPYDPAYPVVCYDERPCFLIGDQIEPVAMQTGQIRKEYYAYEKNGSCALLTAIEPLTGNRLAQVHSHRTKKEYTLFGQALADRFEFFFTPKSASWLNMIEIEFSALTRLCLDRRIPCQEQLEREFCPWLLNARRKESRLPGSSRCNRLVPSSTRTIRYN